MKSKEKQIVIFTQDTMASTVATRQIILENSKYIKAIVVADQLRADSLWRHFVIAYKLIRKSSLDFGFYKFAESSLYSLLLRLHKLVRSKKFNGGSAISINDLAKRFHIKVIKANDLSSGRFLKRILELRPDYVFCMVNQILKRDVFVVLGHRLLNAHGSYLPKYRGPAQYFWYLLDGAKRFGITLHFMDSGVDSGEMVFRRKFPFDNNVSAYRLHYLIAVQFGKAFNLFIKKYMEKDEIKTFRQNNKYATFTHLPTKGDMRRFRHKKSKLITLSDFVSCT